MHIVYIPVCSLHMVIKEQRVVIINKMYELQYGVAFSQFIQHGPYKA